MEKTVYDWILMNFQQNYKKKSDWNFSSFQLSWKMVVNIAEKFDYCMQRYNKNLFDDKNL